MVAVTVTQILIGAGSFIVGLAAVVVALGVLAKSTYVGRPLRWLWRRLVSQPIGEWNRQIVSGVVDTRIEHLMHHRNNGSSLLDLSDKLAHVANELDEVKGRITGVGVQAGQLLEHDHERDTEGKRYGS